MRGFIIALAIIFFVGGLLSFMVEQGRGPEVPVADRIARECQNEFGSRGEALVTDCQLRLLLKTLADSENDKLNAAYKRSK
jgi:hypothetical protein